MSLCHRERCWLLSSIRAQLIDYNIKVILTHIKYLHIYGPCFTTHENLHLGCPHHQLWFHLYPITKTERQGNQCVSFGLFRRKRALCTSSVHWRPAGVIVWQQCHGNAGLRVFMSGVSVFCCHPEDWSSFFPLLGEGRANEWPGRESPQGFMGLERAAASTSP